MGYNTQNTGQNHHSIRNSSSSSVVLSNKVLLGDDDGKFGTEDFVWQQFSYQNQGILTTYINIEKSVLSKSILKLPPRLIVTFLIKIRFY